MDYNFKKIFWVTGGFTLIESVVVILIAGVILSCTFSIKGFTDRQKLTAAASQVAADIRLTQQLNMNQDGVYRLVFDCRNEKYYIIKGLSVYKTVCLPSGIDLVATNFDFDNNSGNSLDNELRFNANGEPFRINGVLIGGHLSLRDKNGNFLYVIVASVSGRVRVDTAPPQ